MTRYKLSLENITKVFGRRLIFADITREFKGGEIYGLAGKNGSGKSTLAKIISGIISPTKGKINHFYKDEKIIPEKLHNHLGFVSPYLVLYDEFTAWENLSLFAQIRGIRFDIEKVNILMDKFEILDRKGDLLKEYSSGMKQRMKFLFALLHSPQLLILDEPTSNLDSAGKEKVYEIIEEEAKQNLIIIASNESSDLSLCSDIIRIEDYKG